MLHEFFRKYWDIKHSVRYIFDMWKSKTIKKSNKQSELDWPVLQEFNTNSDMHAWEIPYAHSYEGPRSGLTYVVSNTLR